MLPPGRAVATMVNWVFNFIVTLTFPWVSENFGDCTASEQWVQHAIAAGQTC